MTHTHTHTHTHSLSHTHTHARARATQTPQTSCVRTGKSPTALNGRVMSSGLSPFMPLKVGPHVRLGSSSLALRISGRMVGKTAKTIVLGGTCAQRFGEPVVCE